MGCTAIDLVNNLKIIRLNILFVDERLTQKPPLTPPSADVVSLLPAQSGVHKQNQSVSVSRRSHSKSPDPFLLLFIQESLTAKRATMTTTIMKMLSFRRLSQVQLNAKLQHVQQRSFICFIKNKIAKKECSSSSSQNLFLCPEGHPI